MTLLRIAIARVALILLLDALARSAIAADPVVTAEWTYTEGAAGGGRFSELTDITAANVSQLEVAWHYEHADFWEGRFPLTINGGTSAESTPIVVDGRLFVTTPANRVIALDPETGRELWTFDPKLERGRNYANMWINRGVAWWRDASASGECAARVFLATLDARLIALDPQTGKPCVDFGSNGTVNLLAGITPLHDDWEYNVTSPGTVVGDRIVIGSSIADTLRPDAPPGDVRAFDVRTGALVWTFHTIPHDGEPGRDTWENGITRTGAANVWSTATADLARGLVFLPVSTASPDYYGGERLGANLYSDSIVALDAGTGAVRWHYQTVHHDLWDYDLASPPVLVTIRRGKKTIDAVAQATKTGFVFVLDRETGAPLFPVEEKPFPASDVPGERTWPTQPIPSAPPPLVPQRLGESDLYAPTAEHLAACKEELATLRNEGLFTPPSESGSIAYPFSGGGSNWSGAAFDPSRQILVVPVQNLAHVIHLGRVAPHEVGDVKPLHGASLGAIWWLLTGRGTGERYVINPVTGRTLFAVDGVPCNKPPWGELVAVDLERGAIAWRAPIWPREGEHDGHAVFSFGPPLATASGLLFHGGTATPDLRVHDLATGAQLARFPLPAGLHAGPITYKLRSDGKQFVVIAPGGHIGIGSKLGGHVIAYTLPDVAADRP